MVNSVVLVGRLVADPELKYTPSGVAVCTLGLAVDRRFKSASGEKQTDFFDIVCWRQSAEFAANYLGKGRLVAVCGSLQQRTWTQTDGQKRSKIEVVADSIQGLDRPRETSANSGGNAPDITSYSAPSGTPSTPQDDVEYDPFSEE